MKPSGFSLSVEATRDVFADKRLLAESMKVVLPLAVLLNIVMQTAGAMEYAWAGFVVIPFSLFIYGCFALSWHRYALRGFTAENTVNPLRVRKGDGAFLLSFTIIMAGYSLAVFGLQMLSAFIVLNYMADYETPIYIAGALFILATMPFFIRILFLLPAKSIGMKTGFKEARRAARGMVWPVIGAILIFCLLFFVFIVVYMFSIGAALNIAIGTAEISVAAAVTVSVLGALPLQIAVFIIFALYTVTISKAYQWGIQNNAIGAADKT